MYKNKLLIVATSLIFLSQNIISQSLYPKWDFLFPLDIETSVSGSFGELRSNHFHSGVDFTTNRETGFPIYAIDDGYVFRIAVSPLGFGKAVYVNHPNGHSSVYAHLEWFSNKLEDIITPLQYQNKSYAIDQIFPANKIPIKRGEVIAFSGNSGSSSGPHLHFEIRESGEQKPLNVHRFNLPVKDDVAPHIEAICLYPMDEKSTINGNNIPVYIPAVFHSGRFHLRGNPAINASGTIGVGIETLDYLTGSWRKCGVYSIQLNVDNKKWFRSQLDGFLFSQTRYINSHIDYRRYITNKQHIQKSFLDDNNLLNIYYTGPDKGLIKITAGETKQFQYLVSDAAGNLSELRFNINGVESPSDYTKATNEDVEFLDPQKAYSTKINGISISFPANSFYTKVKKNFSVIPSSRGGISDHVSVLDETIPIHQYFEITIPIPASYHNNPRVTGALVKNNGQLIHVNGKRQGNYFTIRSREAGVYCLTIDQNPPTVRLINTPTNKNYSNRKSIQINIHDDFSGIASYQCIINGKWQLFEYDPKNKLLTGYFHKMNLAKGNNYSLEVEAVDYAGNKTVLKTDFFY